ncbi:hypothetical protein EDD27_1321 [Nonomuraea polychroma]|uniref:Uncharacterized protein n=1 Tax=Nonomuraea polychroma TaxID=46176 RepID=A0A438LZL8_9ACTN|nr:hypothetical protein EDD27_1321 [Nonomuraea polychroma]
MRHLCLAVSLEAGKHRTQGAREMGNWARWGTALTAAGLVVAGLRLRKTGPALHQGWCPEV